jgi:hypothetical protein
MWLMLLNSSGCIITQLVKCVDNMQLALSMTLLRWWLCDTGSVQIRRGVNVDVMVKQNT